MANLILLSCRVTIVKVKSEKWREAATLVTRN
jgi:hypothetical protein